MSAALPSAPVLLGFIGASAAILVIPGPSVMYVVARSFGQGQRAGLYSMLGLETGAALHVLAAAVGLTGLLTSSEAAFTVTRYVGAGYLLWLASRELRRGCKTIAGPTELAEARGLRLYFDGVLIDLTNPKTAAFFLAFLPQFVDPARSAAPQFAVLGGLFILLAALVDGTYAIIAGRISPRLRSSTRARERLRKATGGVYLALAGVTVIA